jgi:peptidoglycan/LPS O-acetylase OafA/YrhL
MKNFKRIFLLDIARGIAAFCVVLQHYQHFYIDKNNFSYSDQPFFKFLSFFYKSGSQAVPFFFMLSGFIFFYFYKKKIFNNQITFINFTILRLTRLYPLHLLTLIIVIFFQHIFFFEKNYFIWEANSIKIFFFHLFLIQEWPFIKSNSLHQFNAPSFSISIEFFLYILFYFISLCYAKNFSQILTINLIAIIIFCIERSSLALGILLFFYGGLIFYLILTIKKFIKKKFVITALLIVNFIIFSKLLNDFFLVLQLKLIPITGERLMILLYFVKFPLIIINLVLIQIFFQNAGKSFKIFGDISYTVYLVHFPVQILLYAINTQFFNVSYNSELFFLLYILFVFLISIFVYKFFELPLKKILRKKIININS